MGLPSSVTEFDEVCTQLILGKASFTVIRVTKAHLHVSTFRDPTHNSRKNDHTLT